MNSTSKYKMKNNIGLTISGDNIITLESGNFLAEGFQTGFVLFHAFRYAFIAYMSEICEDLNENVDDFNEYIQANSSELDKIPSNVLDDFNLTLDLYNSNFDRRIVINEWCSPTTDWYFSLDFLFTGGEWKLLFTAHGADFTIDFCGWDYSDTEKSILNHPYPDISLYILNHSEVDYHTMLEDRVYDESGKSILLCETMKRDFSDIKLVDLLLADVNDNILDKDTYESCIDNLSRTIAQIKSQN